MSYKKYLKEYNENVIDESLRDKIKTGLSKTKTKLKKFMDTLDEPVEPDNVMPATKRGDTYEITTTDGDTYQLHNIVKLLEPSTYDDEHGNNDEYLFVDADRSAHTIPKLKLKSLRKL